MIEQIYIETTIVSYLTSQPNRDVVIAGHQQTTHEWWVTQRKSYELCISQLVIGEAAAGDSRAARKRLALLQPMTVLETTAAALELTKQLIQAKALPAKAVDDALHIAVAATHAIPYLLTWNCRHLANAADDRICLRRQETQGPDHRYARGTFGAEVMNDPIVEEVQRIRDAHAARFNYDLDVIFQDIKEQEKKSGHKFVSEVARKTVSESQDSRLLHDSNTREAARTADCSH